MNGEDFEKQDAFIRENLKAMRPKEVPEPVLRGFREGVEKKIKSGAVQPLRMGFPPQAVFALSAGLVLAAAYGLFFYSKRSHPETIRPAVVRVPQADSAQAFDPAQRASHVSLPAVSGELPEFEDVFSEVELLEALGVWTQEDDRSAGLDAAGALREVELLFDGDSFAPAPAL